MEIRKDFASAATYLHRLLEIGQAFGQYAVKDWSHLKNQEDFDRTYLLEQPRRRTYENLYADGRDMAYFMSDHLRDFNSVADYPSMSDYVESFERNWCAKVGEHRARWEDLQQHTSQSDTPWAVRQMIGLWGTQVKLLEAINATVSLLKQTDIYRIEKGEIKVSDLGSQNVNIGVIGSVHGSKVNVNSTDSSTTINITNDQIFTSIKDALTRADLPETEKSTLLKHVDAMASDVGKPTFVQRYRDFIATGANHMALLTPFIPKLTALLGGG